MLLIHFVQSTNHTLWKSRNLFLGIVCTVCKTRQASSKHWRGLKECSSVRGCLVKLWGCLVGCDLFGVFVCRLMGGWVFSLKSNEGRSLIHSSEETGGTVDITPALRHFFRFYTRWSECKVIPMRCISKKFVYKPPIYIKQIWSSCEFCHLPDVCLSRPSFWVMILRWCNVFYTEFPLSLLLLCQNCIHPLFEFE